MQEQSIPTTAQPRAVIYCRVSTAGQEDDGTSLDTQLDRCRAYATDHGYRVVGEYREVFTGANLHDRPQLGQLRGLVRQRDLDAVICYAVDRLSRDQAHIAILIDEFERHSVTFACVSEPFENTAVGKFILNARTFAAEIEREKIRERSVRGKRARLEAGKLAGYGSELYGYRRDREHGTRHIYEPEAAIVREMYRLVAEEGASMRSVHAWLERTGVPSPSVGKRDYADGRVAHWSKNYVGVLLRHPAYKGETIFWQTRYAGPKRRNQPRPVQEHVRLPDDVTPPIVSVDLWETVAARLASNGADATRNTTRPYLLRGHVWCDRCHRRMYSCPHRGVRHYRCSSREGAAGWCGAPMVQADALEAWLWDEIMTILENPALITAEADRLRESGPDAGLVAALDAARRQLAKLNRQQARNLAAFTTADDDDDDALTLFTRQREAINQERDRMKVAVADLEGRLAAHEASVIELETVADYCRHVRAELATFDFDERRRTLDALQIDAYVDGSRWRYTGIIPPSEAGGVVNGSWWNSGRNAITFGRGNATAAD